jgi:hypothetical protein
MAAILEPRYTNQSMLHYRGGNCELLEEELVLQNPPHDDIKDCLASVIEIAVPPVGHRERIPGSVQGSNVSFHPRFGGVK